MGHGVLVAAQFHLPGPAEQVLYQRVLVCCLSLVLDQKTVWTCMLTNHYSGCLQCKPNHATQHCSPKTTGMVKDRGCASQKLRACSLWQALGGREGAARHTGIQLGKKLTEAVISMGNSECKNLVRGINY